MQIFATNLDDGALATAREGHWTWASPQWLDYTGQSQEESHGLGWLDMVHPDDHPVTQQAWDEARPHGRMTVEYRVRRASDGAWRWHQTCSVPVRDAPEPDGRISRFWSGSAPPPTSRPSSTCRVSSRY